MVTARNSLLKKRQIFVFFRFVVKKYNWLQDIGMPFLFLLVK